MFPYFKLQLSCLLVICFIGFSYFKSIFSSKNPSRLNNKFFTTILILGFFEVIFDGLTSVFVNNQHLISENWNIALHLIFFILLDCFVFFHFLYILQQTNSYPSHKHFLVRFFIYIPFILSEISILVFLGELQFKPGRHTNFSMGCSVYSCFIMVAVYLVATLAVILKKFPYLSSSKKLTLLTFFLVVMIVAGFQMIFPEILMTSLAVTLLVTGLYLNIANPLYSELSDYNTEMVMGFATLVENRDDNTGGHIRRTSAYVELLAKELEKNRKYSRILTADYIENLRLAAPMHDVGKIAIPDAILLKPGRLEKEEFEIMKSHSERGSEIIKKTFGKTSSIEFTKMAYEVARYHHEKWNGKGYPEGLSGDAIPLSARIMAIADVFDAVTEKRCYKDAQPVEVSFEIIEKGAGVDFDPELAAVFLSLKPQIVEIHHQICNHKD